MPPKSGSRRKEKTKKASTPTAPPPQKASSSPQSTPASEGAVHNAAAPSGGATPPSGVQDAAGVGTTFPAGTDQSAAAPKTPAQESAGSKHLSEQDAQSDISELSAADMKDRFEEMYEYFQQDKSKREATSGTAAPRARNLRRDNSAVNPPSAADAPVFVLEQDATGATIYDFTDEQYAQCLSQPWSKWINHFSPDGTLKLVASEELNGHLRTLLAYQSHLPHKKKITFAENMLPPPVPDELTPLNSFTSREGSYARRHIDPDATPSLADYTSRMKSLSSKDNFGPGAQKGFQHEVSLMTLRSGFSVAQILYQPFPGMFAQTGEMFFQGQLQPIGSFAMGDDDAERPRQRGDGKLTAPVSAVVSIATSQLSKLTIQQSHRWDQQRTKLPENVWDALNYTSKCSGRLIKQGLASITETCRQEAVIWESCQKAVVNLLKLHAQMLIELYPQVVWVESYLSAWLSGDQAAAYTWADPKVPPTIRTYALESIYSFNICAGQNAFSVMLHEYASNGSTNTQELLMDCVSYAYIGQGGKEFVLTLEQKFTEGRENSKPPFGYQTHPAFADVLLLDQAVTCFFAAAQKEDSGMPHTDRMEVLAFYKAYNNGTYSSFLTFKEHVLHLVTAGHLLPQATYAPPHSVQQQASFGALTGNKSINFNALPAYSLPEYVGSMKMLKKNLGNKLFFQHFEPITVKGRNPKDYQGDTHRYNASAGRISIGQLNEKLVDQESKERFYRIIYASFSPPDGRTAHPGMIQEIVDAALKTTSTKTKPPPDPARNDKSTTNGGKSKGKGKGDWKGTGKEKGKGDWKGTGKPSAAFVAQQEQLTEQKAEIEALKEKINTTPPAAASQAEEPPAAAGSAQQQAPPMPNWFNPTLQQQQQQQQQQYMNHMMHQQQQQRHQSLLAAQQLDGGGHNGFQGGYPDGGGAGGNAGNFNQWL